MSRFDEIVTAIMEQWDRVGVESVLRPYADSLERHALEPLTDHMAALIDSAYYEGAKLALIKADESIQVAREWLAGGCNGRRQAALAILRHAPPPRECYHEDRYAGWVCVGCGMVMGECPPVNQPVEQEPDYLATLYALLVRRGYAQDEAHSIAFGDRQEDITQCEFCRNYHWPHCPPSTKPDVQTDEKGRPMTYWGGLDKETGDKQ